MPNFCLTLTSAYQIVSSTKKIGDEKVRRMGTKENGDEGDKKYTNMLIARFHPSNSHADI